MTWQPIETAPRDEIILLYRPSAQDWAKVTIGKWNDQSYHKRPNPFWEFCTCIGSTGEARAWVPTRWMPLPLPPSEA